MAKKNAAWVCKSFKRIASSVCAVSTASNATERDRRVNLRVDVFYLHSFRSISQLAFQKSDKIRSKLAYLMHKGIVDHGVARLDSIEVLFSHVIRTDEYVECQGLRVHFIYN